MKSRIVVALAALAGIFGTFSSRSASAAIHHLHSSMSGAQEVPQTDSAGTGTCDVTVDDVSLLVTGSCTFSGLTSGSTLAHIHAPGAFGVSAGVILPFALNPLGATSGTASGSMTLSAAQVASIIGGQAYTNIHSANFGSGEIRGQIGDFAVSAPTAAAYVINGAPNPTISLTRGKTYLFPVDATGHPFFFSTVANSPGGPHFTDGVTGDPNSGFGMVTFTVPTTAPSTLFYQCGIHPQMSGMINILAPVNVPATGPLAVAGLGALLLIAGIIAIRRRFSRSASV